MSPRGQHTPVPYLPRDAESSGLMNLSVRSTGSSRVQGPQKMRFRSCATLGALQRATREWIGPGLIGARKHPFLTCSLVPASFPEQVAAAPHPAFPVLPSSPRCPLYGERQCPCDRRRRGDGAVGEVRHHPEVCVAPRPVPTWVLHVLGGSDRYGLRLQSSAPG